MKKFLNIFLTLIIFGGVFFAQTTVKVFEKEQFSNNTPSSHGENVIRPDGREAWFWFDKSDNKLPYDVLASGAKITAKLSHTIPWVDDTTLANAYTQGWDLYIVDKQQNRYPIGSGIVQLGDSNYVEVDLSLAGGLLQQDSVAVMYWLGTWAQGSVFLDLDLEIKEDASVKAPYWIEQIASAAGVWSEQKEARWENPKMIIPADTKDRVIQYLGKGGGDHGTQEVNVHFSVDGTKIYEFSPYVEDCEKYLEFNNAIAAYGRDTSDYTAGRTGSCIGGIVEPIIIKGDVFNNALTPGFHSVRFEPQLWEPANWSNYSFSSVMYGFENTGSSSASEFQISASGTEFVAHERSIPVNLYLVNNEGPISNATANIQLSGDGLSFSIDNKNWSNPLSFDHIGASRMVYVKGLSEGTYTMTVEDLNGNLSSSTLELKIYENLARKITTNGVADGSCNWNTEAPQHAIDGDVSTKWCNNDGSEPNWVKYGFDTPQDINYFILHHAAAGGESDGYNSSDFQIKVYNSDTNAWEIFADVTDNTAGVSYHVKDDSFTSVKCDSVMLYLTRSQANGGNVARVYEIEMFNNSNPYTSVKEINNDVPVSFEVFQNYPNPFNPTTEIKFFTPYQAKVDIRIYNVLGQQITELLSGEVASGTHKIHWNGTNGSGSKIAGGVYFYSVRYTDKAGNTQVITKKMILLP